MRSAVSCLPPARDGDRSIRRRRTVPSKQKPCAASGAGHCASGGAPVPRVRRIREAPDAPDRARPVGRGLPLRASAGLRPASRTPPSDGARQEPLFGLPGSIALGSAQRLGGNAEEARPLLARRVLLPLPAREAYGIFLPFLLAAIRAHVFVDLPILPARKTYLILLPFLPATDRTLVHTAFRQIISAVDRSMDSPTDSPTCA